MIQRRPGLQARRFAVSIFILGLSGLLDACSSSGSGGSGYSEYFRVVREAWKAEFSNGAITREQAASVSYASMGWRLNGGPEHLIVLATDTGGEQLWTSAEHIVLVTRDGRILRTVGLPKDLAATTAAAGNQSPAAALQGPLQTSRQQDFPDINRYAVSIRCRAVSRGPESIAILGAAIATIRVEESCAAQGLDWRFTDTFWVDPQSGLSWKTIQHTHPGGTVIQTQIFRPPG